MNTRNLYAILAAGVNQPDLIVQWQNQPEFLEERGVPAESLDLTALWKFSGLAVKVRHNGLRPDFPVSYRLMKLLGLEITLFANFATFCSAKKHKYANSPLQRARDLVAFFKEWRDPEAVPHRLLWDTLRHELAVFELQNAPHTASVVRSSQAAGAPIVASAIPVVCGPLILHEMQYDPADIVSALDCRPFLANEVPAATHYFAYQRTRDESNIQVLEIDAFAFYTLGLCNGKHTLAQISGRFGKGSRLSAGFKEAIRDLVAKDILEMRSAA